MIENLLWTHLSPKEIQQLLLKEYQLAISLPSVRKLLRFHKFRRRKAQKNITMGQVANRNEQFENIARLRQAYIEAGNPLLSMDTKKKEYLGNFYREGRLYTQGVLETYDHDFVSTTEGVVIPHALYDLQLNHGYIHLGTSKDTSEFACDSIRHWWFHYGQYLYPEATSILLLCDGGGSNSSHYYIFKEELQKLVNEIGIEIRIAHYPPYCSKYNPIEHRLFPHVTRACQGVIFKSVELVKTLIARTTTATGLAVTVAVFNKIYQTNRKVSKTFRDEMSILFDEYLPKWNYRAKPHRAI